MTMGTKFIDYLREELRDPEFVQGYAEANEAWDMVIDLVKLREARGLTQAQLAEMVGTKQQNIARIENPAYEGHSLSLLRRVARALGMVVHVEFIPPEQVVARELGDLEKKPSVYPQTQAGGEEHQEGGGREGIAPRVVPTDPAAR